MIKDATAGRGRRHRSREEADQLAAEYEASGLSREEFCRRRKVAMKTLARYVARYRKQLRGAEQPGNARWVAVEVGGERGDGGQLAIVLPGGRRIEVKAGFDSQTLRQLVCVLEEI